MERLTLIVLLLFGFSGISGCQSDQKVPQTPPNPVQPASPAEPIMGSVADLKKELKEEGYEIFDYVDSKTGDTVLMQQYFIAFLKSGPVRSQSKEVTDSLQNLHMAHLGRMYEEGFADISGPFGDDGEIRGITIYNTPTLRMADSLANLDPMVKAGRLVIEVHPWWAAKGFPLR